MKVSIITLVISTIMAATALAKKPNDPPRMTNCQQVKDEIDKCEYEPNNLIHISCNRPDRKEEPAKCCRKSPCAATDNFGWRNCHELCAI
ncbi:hypothetical protein NX059_005086 [Plenodomus lindquistii]|nr:hypothetical protein NX059_005086 [Plenodomus lindquistii]